MTKNAPTREKEPDQEKSTPRPNLEPPFKKVYIPERLFDSGLIGIIA